MLDGESHDPDSEARRAIIRAVLGMASDELAVLLDVGQHDQAAVIGGKDRALLPDRGAFGLSCRRRLFNLPADIPIWLIPEDDAV